jgi:hypothetical protein
MCGAVFYASTGKNPYRVSKWLEFGRRKMLVCKKNPCGGA